MTRPPSTHTVQSSIERHDGFNERIGRERLSDLLDTVTLPDDLSESVRSNVARAHARGQRLSDHSLKCLVLYERGEMTHDRYVCHAHAFDDLEGITPMYLRQLNT